MSSLRDRLSEVRGRIERAAERSGRSPADVQLVAVSKTVSPDVMIEAFGLGQIDFGENRIQEYRDKREVLDTAGIRPRYHMVGHLQSNKAKTAVSLFDIIQSVDSTRLAGILARAAEEAGKRLPILLEVDFSGDPGRPGFSPEELESAARELAGLRQLEIKGLMTVAPLGLDEAGQRAVFRRTRALRDVLESRHGTVDWRDLSMGMSDDYEIAVEEGATIVRVGRAIFGERAGAKGMDGRTNAESKG